MKLYLYSTQELCEVAKISRALYYVRKKEGLLPEPDLVIMSPKSGKCREFYSSEKLSEITGLKIKKCLKK
jgi:hypothetical protein